MDRHKCLAVLFLICCALEFYTDYETLRYYSDLSARIEEFTNTKTKTEEIKMQQQKKIKKNIDAINKFGEHKTKTVELSVSDCNDFDDFAIKVLKYKDLFELIHLESINLFEDIKSVELSPRCIPQLQYRNGEICFKKTEIHNLENLKLTYIELGINMIRQNNDQIYNYTYIVKKFDNLFITGTIDNANSDDQDKYNISVRNGEFTTWHDYFNPEFFNLVISSKESLSGENINSDVTHAVKMDLKYINDMKFKLPVRGFDGLLELLENEIHIPTKFIPNEMNYNCMIVEKYQTFNRTIFFKTNNTILLKQPKDNVINSVRFFENGDSYHMEFYVYFKELFWTTNFTVQIDKQLNIVDCALFHLKELEINVTYIPNNVPAYNVYVFNQNPIYISSTEKMMPYFNQLHALKKYLEDCISGTIKNSLELSLKAITKDGITLGRVKYVYV